jgi:hypothetical protein
MGRFWKDSRFNLQLDSCDCQAGSKAKVISSLQIRGIRVSEDKKRSSNDENPPCFMNDISVEGVRLCVVEGVFRDLPFGLSTFRSIWLL